MLSTIYTPYNLTLSVSLPTSDSDDVWYRSDGTMVTELPQNLSYSVALGKNYIPEEKDANNDGDDDNSSDTSQCGDNLTWTLTKESGEYVLTISGTGEMYDYDLSGSVSTAPWVSKIASKTVRLNIEDGVESIGENAFYGCSGLTGNVILPESVTSIGANAFYNCTSLTDFYISEKLEEINGNPFQYLNVLISALYSINIDLTFHCIKDSYAYQWAKDNGFTVEEWDGVTIDIKITDITVNGKGYAYAYFLLRDNDGKIQKNAEISYSFGTNTYTATSDSDGYVIIKSELVSTGENPINKLIKTSKMILDPEGEQETLNSRVVMDIEVVPFTYTQKWKLGVQGTVEAGLSAGASETVGVAEIGASLGKALATGSEKGSVSLEIEHSGDSQDIKLEQNFKSKVGVKASIGPEAKASALCVGFKLDEFSASDSASIGAGQGIGLKIDDYDPSSLEDNLNIGKFAIAMLGSQTGNSMLIELVDCLGLDLYNTADKSVGFYLTSNKAGGTITYGNSEIETLTRLEENINYTYTVGRDETNSTLYKKMELESSTNTKLSGYDIPVIKNLLSQGYLDSYAITLTENNNNISQKLKIDLKTADETTQFGFTNRESETLSVEFGASATQKLEENISPLKQLKLGSLPFITMAAAKEGLMMQIDEVEVEGTYSRSKTTSYMQSAEIPIGTELIASLKVKWDAEGVYELKYDTESGIYQNGTSIKTSEVSDASDMIAETDWCDFVDFFADPIEIAWDEAKSFIVDIKESIVDGITDTYVTVKAIVTEGIDAMGNWVLHVIKIDGGSETQSFNSYSIVAVNASAEEQSDTETVVFTVSNAYYVYLTDENEQTIDSFEECPLELTLKYTDEMLSAAGVSADDADHISVYQYSEELCGYVCIGGTIDAENCTVTTTITQSGQYVLAADGDAPAVTGYSVSEDTNMPLISVDFNEVSGFKEFSFQLDEEEVIGTSDWRNYYNKSYNRISYQVETELSNGRHTFSVYAVDSAGNAMSEPFEQTFYIGSQQDYGDVLYEDIPSDGVIPEGMWIAGATAQTYTGKAIKPEIRVYDGTTLLQEKKDYTVSYKNNVKVNDAEDEKKAPTITVKGKGNYSGSETAVFAILPVDLSSDQISVEELVAASNGKVQNPFPTVKFGGKKLTKKDIAVTYSDESEGAYKEIGEYTITINGIGNFSGTRSITLTITDKTLLSKAKVQKIAAQDYTGSALQPELTVTLGKETLKKGTDYTVSYDDNVEIGTARAVITGINSYIGTKTVTFKISGGTISKAVVSGLQSSVVYTGKAVTQSCSLTAEVAGVEKTLTEGTDYTVSYLNNKSAGTATMIFTGINGYTGTLKKSFKITPYDIGSDSDAKLTLPKQLTAVYAKKGSTPKPVVVFGACILTEGVDYTLSYKNNKAVNDGTDATKAPKVIIKGKGNFTGTRSMSFTIEQQTLSNVTIAVSDRAYQNKAGAYQSVPKLTDTDGKLLSAGKDYDKNIVYTYAEQTTLADGTVRNAGEEIDSGDLVPALTQIHVTVSAAENSGYTGSISGTYRIVQSDIAKAKVTVETQEYTGNEVKPEKSAVTVKLGKETLDASSYEIAGYGDNCINKGKNTITIKGIGNYGGTKTVTYQIKAKSFWWWWRK